MTPQVGDRVSYTFPGLSRAIQAIVQQVYDEDVYTDEGDTVPFDKLTAAVCPEAKLRKLVKNMIYVGVVAKLISLDMRVVDANWIGMKLRKLINFGEPNGDFWAPVPGADRSAIFPSTVSYIAALLLHRYKVLGILDDDGRAIRSAGILTMPEGRKAPEQSSAPIKGKVCPGCGAAAMIKRDGCEFCTACGFTGACG